MEVLYSRDGGFLPRDVRLTPCSPFPDPMGDDISRVLQITNGRLWSADARAVIWSLIDCIYITTPNREVAVATRRNWWLS